MAFAFVYSNVHEGPRNRIAYTQFQNAIPLFPLKFLRLSKEGAGDANWPFGRHAKSCNEVKLGHRLYTQITIQFRAQTKVSPSPPHQFRHCLKAESNKSNLNARSSSFAIDIYSSTVRFVIRLSCVCVCQFEHRNLEDERSKKMFENCRPIALIDIATLAFWMMVWCCLVYV